MPGENNDNRSIGKSSVVLQDRSEPEDENAELTEVERGRLIDEDRKAARTQALNELDAAMKADGRALDLKAAHVRCFAAGTSEPERLVNDERPS